MSNAKRRKKLKNTRDAGRDKLLEAARSLFRSRVKREVSRQEIARAAGLVPGLVTYYFETNAALVLAATRPVLAEAIAKLIAAIDAPEPPEERLRRCIVLFIDFGRENSSLLDLFVEAALDSGDEDAKALIYSCLNKLGQFLGEAIQAGLVSGSTDPRLLLLAMWGMCRLVAETPPLPIHDAETQMEPERRRQAEATFITNLILHGVAANPRRE